MSAADEYFKKAEQALKKGNNEYAVELYLQGLIIDPKRSEERRKLHKVETLAVQEKGGNPQGGMSVRLKVMPIQANLKKLTMQKKWDEAVIEIERCLRFQPQNVPTLFALAVALENLEADDGAIATFEEIVELEKTNVEAYRKLGMLWAKKNEPEKAIAYWEKVQLYKPDHKEAGKAIRDLSAATMVKKAEDRKSKSGDASFKALLKSEDESAELEKKAKIIRNDDDRREAIKFKKDDLRKDPTNSRLWRELGGLYQDLKMWREAEIAFKKALEVNPHDLAAPEKLGTLRELKMEEELKVLQAEIETKRAAGADVTELEAKLSQQEADFKLFKVGEYDRRVKAHPTDFELKVRFGELLLMVGKYDDAIGQFQKSVADPKWRVISLNLNGTCFREKGLYKVAEQQYLDALNGVAEKNSELGKEIKYNLGLVCEKKGDKGGALGWYEQIMAVDIAYRDVSSRVNNLMNGDGPAG